MRHERKTRWKELQDEKTGRRFYYNKISGEVRWRTPQDVLDLMPRPVCGDCNYFEAVIECANCAVRPDIEVTEGGAVGSPGALVSGGTEEC